MELQYFYANGNGLLEHEEICVIMAMIEKVLAKMQRFNIAGSLLITERMNGASEASYAIELDFEKGTDVGNRYLNDSSHLIVEYVADNFKPQRNKSGYIASVNDEFVDEEILFFRTGEGYVTCNVCMDYPYVEVELYVTVAKTIAMLRPNDKKTQKAYNQLLEEEGSSQPILWMIDSYIDEEFKKCRDPRLKAWKKWYNKH